MEKNIAVLAGDGIGPEVMRSALFVLNKISDLYQHKFSFQEGLVGGAAYDVYGQHFPEETRELCQGSDAILFGSVGGPVAEAHLPKWQNCEAKSLLSIRKSFKFNANFRPARVYPQLMDICPLKKELIENGVDLLVVRELIGDIYFGEHKTFERDGKRVATDVAEYDEDQIASVAHAGFQAAMKRRKKITSVDKANVLDTSKLWRKVVSEVAKEYPEVQCEDMLVDNCAMQIIKNPAQFDVILTANLFGDILSDAASVLPGSLGLLGSASLNAEGFGFYEPAGGSAPDIAGKGIANPIAQILSVSMMLKYSFGLTAEANAVESAVNKALDKGYRTADIAGKNDTAISTTEMTERIIAELKGN
jgi:3-isopropylmalate dehydrogenase